MGMRALESAILAELRRVENNRKIRLKDIVEWSTGEVKPNPKDPSEKILHLKLSEFGNQPISVAYKPQAKKKTAKELDNELVTKVQKVVKDYAETHPGEITLPCDKHHRLPCVECGVGIP